MPPDFAPRTAERVARNDAMFREANEGIRESAERHAFEAPVPFLCECADPTCRELVRIDLDGYAEVRSSPRRFLNAPGHEGVDLDYAEVVSSADGYVIVEKIGRAGEVAEELDRGER